MREIEVLPGQHIHHIFSLAFQHFNESEEPVTFQHNALRVIVFKDVD